MVLDGHPFIKKMQILKIVYPYWLILESSDARLVLLASKLPCNLWTEVIATTAVSALHIDNSSVINKKTLVRQHLWLQKMDNDIGSHLNSRKLCLSNKIAPVLGPFYLQKWAGKSHETDAIDFAGKGKTSLFYCYWCLLLLTECLPQTQVPLDT